MTVRQAGKKSNHGLNYGMGYRRFALENEMPETEARNLHTLYSQQAYVRLPHWWEATKEQLRKTRELHNCFGRKRHFFGEWGAELFDQAYSFVPQSTVVDIVNQAMCDIYEDQSPLFRPMELLAQVHDSLLVQYPTGNLQDLAHFIEAMAVYLAPELEYNGHKFKIGVDAKVGFRWGSGGMRGLPADFTVDTLKEVLQ
jgi:DNA polymerase I-like protein with 3'-5' exonuclease and polymerase domains